MQKVALPTDGAGHLVHFGRAPIMSVLSVDNGQVVGREDRRNPDPDHMDPAHHKIMMNLVQGADVVIATHMGPPMVASLNRVGAKVLVAPSEDVDQTLQAYLSSLQGGPSLSEMTVEAAEAAHSHGHDHHHDHDHHHH